MIWSLLLDDTPPAPGMIRVVGANGKAEWKRYKQYTKDDILAAIEEVKAGASALQASRKYGVPSRTLYDKVIIIFKGWHTFVRHILLRLFFLWMKIL